MKLKPIHPGEILREEFLRPAGLSATALAKAIGVQRKIILDTTRERRGITEELARKLAVYWSTSPEIWIGLQAEYEARRRRRR